MTHIYELLKPQLRHNHNLDQVHPLVPSVPGIRVVQLVRVDLRGLLDLDFPSVREGLLVRSHLVLLSHQAEYKNKTP